MTNIPRKLYENEDFWPRTEGGGSLPGPVTDADLFVQDQRRLELTSPNRSTMKAYINVNVHKETSRNLDFMKNEVMKFCGIYSQYFKATPCEQPWQLESYVSSFVIIDIHNSCSKIWVIVKLQGAELPLALSTTHSPVWSPTDPTERVANSRKSPVIANHDPIVTST